MKVRELFEALAPFSTPAAPEVLVLGDSVMEYLSGHDVDRRNLPQIIADTFPPELPVFPLGFYAANARLYRRLVEVLDLYPHFPRVVIAPLSLRSFSPLWDRNPQQQCPAALAALDEAIAHIRRRAQVPFDVAETPLGNDLTAPMASQRGVQAPFKLVGERDLGELLEAWLPRSMTFAENLRKRWLFHVVYYLFEFDETHPLFADWRRLIEVVRSRGSRLVLYSAPFNHFDATTHVGTIFPLLLDENLAVLRRFAAAAGGAGDVRYHELATQFPPDCFYDPVEHLNEHGRQRLAGMMLEWSRARLPAGGCPPDPVPAPERACARL